MTTRPYRKLYTGTIALGLDAGADVAETAAAIHDCLVAAGFDISNVIRLDRTTKKQLAADYKELGVA